MSRVWIQGLIRTHLVPLPTALNVHMFSGNIIIYNYLHDTSHNTTHWHVTGTTRRLLATTTTTTSWPRPWMDATGTQGRNMGSRPACLEPHLYVFFLCFFLYNYTSLIVDKRVHPPPINLDASNYPRHHDTAQLPLHHDTNRPSTTRDTMTPASQTGHHVITQLPTPRRHLPTHQPRKDPTTRRKVSRALGRFFFLLFLLHVLFLLTISIYLYVEYKTRNEKGGNEENWPKWRV